MAKVSLSEHMQEQRRAVEDVPADAGPFVTISRQFGCYGFNLGLLLMEIVNESPEPGKVWKIYHKEILAKLATETNLTEGVLDRQRRSKPGLLTTIFHSLSPTKAALPSAAAIRKRINAIIRGLAIDGYAIIVGQGGEGAAHDLPNGLSVRMEAPEEWRIKQVAFREGLGETQARLRIRAMEEEREYLRKSHIARRAERPAFSLVYDCSQFTLTQIAQQVAYAMKLRGLI